MDLRAMDLRGYQFIQREIGEDAVYPGHPITVGLLIMCAFPTLEAAEDRGPEGQNFTAASRSSMIPGAGGSVGTALGILRDVVKGVLTITGAIARADEAWRDVDGQYVRDPKRWREGQEQANPLKARYTTLLHSWGPVADAPCAKCAKVFSFAPPLPDLPQGRGRLWSELIRTTETELIVKPSTEVMTSAMGLCTSSPGDTKS